MNKRDCGLRLAGKRQGAVEPVALGANFFGLKRCDTYPALASIAIFADLCAIRPSFDAVARRCLGRLPAQ